MPEQEPQPEEKIRAIVVCSDSRDYFIRRFLQRNGIEILGIFDSPFCTELKEFWEKKAKLDVAVIHSDEKRGRQFVQDSRTINPNLFILTFSGRAEMLRFGDTFMVMDLRQESLNKMLLCIREGVATRRNIAKPIAGSLP